MLIKSMTYFLFPLILQLQKKKKKKKIRWAPISPSSDPIKLTTVPRKQIVLNIPFLNSLYF